MTQMIDVEEVQRMLQIHDINIDDEKAEGLIEYYSSQIMGLTGISLDIQTYHYTIQNKRFVDKIVLPLFDIFDVDQVHVDYKLLDDKKYFTDTKNGVIFFKEPLSYATHIHIKYLTRVNEEAIKNIILPLVVDMIIDGEKDKDGEITGEITSIHEGNTSISLKNSTNLKDSIQNRLDKLAKGEINGLGVNRKGAYYI